MLFSYIVLNETNTLVVLIKRKLFLTPGLCDYCMRGQFERAVSGRDTNQSMDSLIIDYEIMQNEKLYSQPSLAPGTGDCQCKIAKYIYTINRQCLTPVS